VIQAYEKQGLLHRREREACQPVPSLLLQLWVSWSTALEHTSCPRPYASCQSGLAQLQPGLLLAALGSVEGCAMLIPLLPFVRGCSCCLSPPAEALNLWLAFYCDFFGAVLVLAVAAFAVFQKTDRWAPPTWGWPSPTSSRCWCSTPGSSAFWRTSSPSGARLSASPALALNTPKETDLAPPKE